MEVVMADSFRRIIRQIILESIGTKGYKMIFLAGLPGGGKSTLLRQLDIEDKFTNCNIDNFFEPMLIPELGTMKLEIPHGRRRKLAKIRKNALSTGIQLTQDELDELTDLEIFADNERRVFQKAIGQFRKQVDEVCEIGSNFIIDGTAANADNTIKKAKKFQKMGYECAMIMVDIDIETSQQRNTARGAKGDRAIDRTIIWRQGQNMPGNIPIYENFFGENFFLVQNRGTFAQYKANIELIRPGIQAFMES